MLESSGKFGAAKVKRGWTYLRHAISEQAKGRAISSSGRKLDAKLRDCATRERAKLTSSGGKSFACVGTSVANACSTGRLFIAFSGKRMFRKRAEGAIDTSSGISTK